MKKIDRKIWMLVIFLTLIIHNSGAQFTISGLYSNDDPLPAQQVTLIGDAFDSLPNIGEVKKLQFSNIDNDKMKEILKELNRRPFNNLQIVDFQYNRKIAPGIFLRDSATTQEFATLLMKPSLDQIKLFGTALAKEVGTEDIIALRMYMIKAEVKNRGLLLDKVTRIAWGG